MAQGRHGCGNLHFFTSVDTADRMVFGLVVSSQAEQE